MSNEKMDRRIRYTKMVLRQSLLELMKTQSISKITVKAICAGADVNRGTFYSHYTDPYDLLNQIEGELYSQMRLALRNYSAAADRNHSTYEVILELFQCIEKNADLCKILLGEHGDTAFLQNIMYVAQRQCEDQWADMVQPSHPQLLRYIYSFMAHGSVGLIQQWIQNEDREPPAEIARVVDRLVSDGLRAYMQGEGDR